MSQTEINKLLLVEDDPGLSELTSRYLLAQGYDILSAENGQKALQLNQQHQFDLIILDLGLPDIDGFEVCRQIREYCHTPILIVTAKNTDIDQVVGLEIGADDYVVKPVEPRVLLARIKAILRRTQTSEMKHQVNHSIESLELGSLCLLMSSQKVTLAGEAIHLTSQEFELLSILMTHAGDIVSREQLFQQLRGFEYDGLDRTVDVRVSKLRKKLGDDPIYPEKIKTIWGKGYLLVPDAWDIKPR